jgi:hypothetical protein
MHKANFSSVPTSTYKSFALLIEIDDKAAEQPENIIKEKL